MSEISGPSIHDAHDRPRLFALRDEGVGWHFVMCNPHPWPGDQWGVKIPVPTAPGKLFGPLEFKRDFDWLASTGLDDVEDARGEFIANLAYAASNIDGVFQGMVVVTPEMFRDPFDDSNILDFKPESKVSPLPGFSPLDADNLLNAERIGSRTWVLEDHSYICYPRSLLDLRSAFIEDLRAHVSIYLTAERDRAFSVGIELDAENWFITTDHPNIRNVCQKLCAFYGIELDESEGRIDEYCPHFSTSWRSRILERRDEERRFGSD